MIRVLLKEDYNNCIWGFELSTRVFFGFVISSVFIILIINGVHELFPNEERQRERETESDREIELVTEVAKNWSICRIQFTSIISYFYPSIALSVSFLGPINF